MKTDIILSDSVMQRGENAANLSLTSVIFRKIEICFTDTEVKMHFLVQVEPERGECLVKTCMILQIKSKSDQKTWIGKGCCKQR